MSEAPVRTGSLRRRVVLAVLGVLLVVLIGMGLVINLVLGDRLRSDLRQRLTDRAGFAQVLSTQNLDFQALADRLTGAGITATYRGGNQVVIGRDQPPPGNGQPGGPRGPRPAVSTAAVTITQQGELLVATLPVQQGTLSLTANLTDIDRTLATLQRIELAAGAATLLVAGLLLTLLVGVAMAPLSRMTRLARRIRDGARGGRLRPTRPKTDLGRTAAAIDEMLDALERAEFDAMAAEGRMRQFLADASHDLRTPIAGVITTAEQVLRDNPDRTAREQRLVSLIREAQRAGRLVDDLLLMARLDGELGLRLGPVSLAEIIEDAVARAELRCPDRTVSTVGEPAVWVSGERDAIERVLANLLDNARHATRPGGEIRVSVSVQAENVLIAVSDSGPGIEPADRQRVFERFIRLDAGRVRSADGGGSGLGLPIARGLARAMNGDLALVPSTELSGATFQLVLRAAQPLMVRPEISASNRKQNLRSHHAARDQPVMVIG